MESLAVSSARLVSVRLTAGLYKVWGTASTGTLHLGTAWESQKRVTVEQAQQGLQAARAPIAPCC